MLVLCMARLKHGMDVGESEASRGGRGVLVHEGYPDFQITGALCNRINEAKSRPLTHIHLPV